MDTVLHSSQHQAEVVGLSRPLTLARWSWPAFASESKSLYRIVVPQLIRRARESCKKGPIPSKRVAVSGVLSRSGGFARPNITIRTSKILVQATGGLVSIGAYIATPGLLAALRSWLMHAPSIKVVR